MLRATVCGHRDGRGFAGLWNWRCLARLRMNARGATQLLRDLLVLMDAGVTDGRWTDHAPTGQCIPDPHQLP